jgi:trk system potassium uptake protein TrkH
MFGVLHLLTQFLGALAFAMLLPATIALVDGDPGNAESFLLVAGLTGFTAGAIFFALRGRRWRLNRFAAFVLVLLLWAVPPLIAAVPIMNGAGIKYLPAVFEAVSAYTTTGATTLSSLEPIGPAVIFWRAELQWLGGLITLLSIVTILAPAGVGGLSDRNLAILGPAGEGSLSRSLATARTVTLVYSGATAFCLCLLIIAGIPVFDSVCLALATLSTGGLMPIEGTLGDYERPLAEAVIAFFMLVGATSIVWQRMILLARWPLVVGHRESYWVIGVALLVGLVYAAEFTGDPEIESSSFAALGQGLFTGISLVTTTGFETSFDGLAALPIAIAGALAIIGAGTMSTAGGIKFFRVGAMCVQSMHEMKRLVYPHSVRSTRFGSQPYDVDLMKAIWAGAIVALGFVAVATLLLTLNHPSFHGSALAAISAFSNIGPLYSAEWDGSVAWPVFADFDAFSKIVVIVTMIIGRIEAVALLTMVNLAYWRS